MEKEQERRSFLRIVAPRLKAHLHWRAALDVFIHFFICYSFIFMALYSFILLSLFRLMPCFFSLSTAKLFPEYFSFFHVSVPLYVPFFFHLKYLHLSFHFHLPLSLHISKPTHAFQPPFQCFFLHKVFPDLKILIPNPEVINASSKLSVSLYLVETV